MAHISAHRDAHTLPLDSFSYIYLHIIHHIVKKLVFICLHTLYDR